MGVAAGSSARAIAVQPHNGVSVAMFIDSERVHAEWSMQAVPLEPLNLSTGTDVETPEQSRKSTVTQGGAKRRRSSTAVLSEAQPAALSTKLHHTYGRASRTSTLDSTAMASSSSSRPSNAPAAGRLDGALRPVTRTNIQRANITLETLRPTALINVKEEVLEKLPVWGKSVLCIIQIALELEAIKSLPCDTLAFSDKHRRPAPIGQFARSHRHFQDNVFSKFKPDFVVSLWKWWILLVDDMRVIDGSGDDRRPGGIRAEADWSRLLVCGQNGLWQVVVAVLVWRKHIERKPSLAHTPESWAAFVVNVKLVFDALLHFVSTCRTKKSRSS
jgi:hypothetical protein